MKRYKGMTLLEVVISIAIFALLSLLIVQSITQINTIIRRTSDMNERIYQEKVYVNTNQTAYMVEVKTYEAESTSHLLSVEYGGKVAYPNTDAIERVTKNDGSQESLARDARLDSGLHFRFLEFGGVTSASSSSGGATGFITLEAKGSSVPQIVSVKISGGGTQKVYQPGTTNETPSYILPADKLDGGDGFVTDGELLFEVKFPEDTSVVEIEWTFCRNGKEETVKSVHTFPASRLNAEGTYETVGEATAYYYDGTGFGYVNEEDAL